MSTLGLQAVEGRKVELKRTYPVAGIWVDSTPFESINLLHEKALGATKIHLLLV